jgi:CheY-like chemotaxis protein
MMPAPRAAEKRSIRHAGSTQDTADPADNGDGQQGLWKQQMPAKRVLVVDDISVIRGFVKAALRDLEVVVNEASNGHQALDMQVHQPSDLILCDLSMPGMDGEAFVKELRERGDTTPVIMLTAHGDRQQVERLLQLGIQGYVLKPFKPGVLSDRVHEVLSGSAPPPPARPAPPPPAADATDDTQPDAPPAEADADAPPDGDAPARPA